MAHPDRNPLDLLPEAGQFEDIFQMHLPQIVTDPTGDVRMMHKRAIAGLFRQEVAAWATRCANNGCRVPHVSMTQEAEKFRKRALDTIGKWFYWRQDTVAELQRTSGSEQLLTTETTSVGVEELTVMAA